MSAMNYQLVRRKRSWVPEWLYYVAANPIPFWNDTVAITFPELRVFIRPLTWLLSYNCESQT